MILPRAAMNTKYLRIIIIIFGAAVFIGTTGWYIAMRPAFRYLDMLGSDNNNVLHSVARSLRGYTLEQSFDGRSNLRPIPSHKPLKGMAARAVKTRIVRLFSEADDPAVLDMFLLATGSGEDQVRTGIIYDEQDWPALDRAMSIANTANPDMPWVYIPAEYTGGIKK